jgi:hypothetical protein
MAVDGGRGNGGLTGSLPRSPNRGGSEVLFFYSLISFLPKQTQKIIMCVLGVDINSTLKHKFKLPNLTKHQIP